MRSLLHVLPVLAMTAALVGCSGQERICGDGEYPVKAIGNTTGRSCVADDQEPPAGYVRYPEGQVPQHIGDEWDTYWDSRIIDANGTVTEAA